MEELPKRLVRHMGKFGWSAEIAEETDEGLRLGGKGGHADQEARSPEGCPLDRGAPGEEDGGACP
jgi:hypothetical protein